jgi:anti-sigma-K factor RskA
VYQLWVVTGGTPISVGLLAPDASGGGTAFFSAPPDMPDPLAMAVTLEPAGGGPAPTGDPYLESTPGAAF